MYKAESGEMQTQKELADTEGEAGRDEWRKLSYTHQNNRQLEESAQSTGRLAPGLCQSLDKWAAASRRRRRDG